MTTPSKDLPEEVEKAIERFGQAQYEHGKAMIKNEETRETRKIRDASRADLRSIISTALAAKAGEE